MKDNIRRVEAAADLSEILSESYPALEVSDQLRERVGRLATERQVQARLAQRRRAWRIGLGFTAATAAACLVMSLVPTVAAAYALRQVQAAITDVSSAHVRSWNVTPEGRRVLEAETWYQQGRWRLEELDPHTIQVCAGGKLWTYQPPLNQVTVRHQNQPFSHAMSGFTVKALLADLTHWGWGDRIQVLADVAEQGRRLRRVVVEDGERSERALLYFDPKTDLPVRHELQLDENGTWTTRRIGEFHFNQALPERLFQPEFPPSARVVDAEEAEEQWRKRLERGLASNRAGDRTLTVRDLQVNSDGDVFLLYTAGKRVTDQLRTGNSLAGRDWKVELRDEFGTRYLWVPLGFVPVVSNRRANQPNGYIIHGERLEGDWWIPLTPQHPWRPRQFTLTLRVDRRNLHGSYQDPPIPAEYTEAATFTVPVTRPEAAVAPDYMPQMALGLTEYAIRRQRLQARALHYWHEQGDRETVLRLFGELVETTEERGRRSGELSYFPQLWMWIGQLNQELGRTEPARAAYERALRERPAAHDRQAAVRALQSLR